MHFVIERGQRNLQDQQTLGIPVGPDSSRLISELIMCDIDTMFLDKYPDKKYLRYVDDFVFPCESYSQAKEELNELIRIFNTYELDLNESKTEIIELPVDLEQDWVMILKQKRIRRDNNHQESDIIAYFQFAFDIYKKYPSKNVLHYALVEKLTVKINQENWDLFESLILQCTLYEPRVFPLVGKILYTYFKMDYPLNKALIHDSLLANYKDKIINQNTYELVWGIFILCQLSIPITINPEELFSTNDTVLLTTLLYAIEKSILNCKIPKSMLQQYMEEENLFSESWLLSYESNVHSWLRNKKGRDICASDPFYSDIKSKGVTFLDLDVNLKEINPRYLDYEEEFFDEEPWFDTSDILYGD